MRVSGDGTAAYVDTPYQQRKRGVCPMCHSTDPAEMNVVVDYLGSVTLDEDDLCPDRFHDTPSTQEAKK